MENETDENSPNSLKCNGAEEEEDNFQLALELIKIQFIIWLNGGLEGVKAQGRVREHRRN